MRTREELLRDITAAFQAQWPDERIMTIQKILQEEQPIQTVKEVIDLIQAEIDFLILARKQERGQENIAVIDGKIYISKYYLEKIKGEI